MLFDNTRHFIRGDSSAPGSFLIGEKVELRGGLGDSTAITATGTLTVTYAGGPSPHRFIDIYGYARSITPTAGPRTPGANDYDDTGTTQAVANSITACINDLTNHFSDVVTAVAGVSQVLLTSVETGAVGNLVVTDFYDGVVPTTSTLTGGQGPATYAKSKLAVLAVGGGATIHFFDASGTQSFDLTPTNGPRTPGANDYDQTGTKQAIANSITAAINDLTNSFSAIVSAVAGTESVIVTATILGTVGNRVSVFSSNTGVVDSPNANLAGGSNGLASGPIVFLTGDNGTIQVDAGGDARGVWAVDLQSIRSDPAQGALGESSLVSGQLSLAAGVASFARGFYVQAFSDYSDASGQGSSAGGVASSARGFFTTTSGDYSTSEGNETVAVGPASHAEGLHSQAGNNSLHVAAHAEGEGTQAYSEASHAEGYFTIVGGESFGGHAEGFSTAAQGQGTHAEGSSTICQGTSGHAEGDSSQVYGVAGHAEGIGSIAGFSDAGHASGRKAATTIDAEWAHASGIGTGGTEGGVQTSIIDVQVETTNATPTVLLLGDIGGGGNPPILPSGTTWGALVVVTARQTGGGSGTVGDSAVFMFQALWRREPASSATLVGFLSLGSNIADAGAAGWTVTLTAVTTTAAVQVTGEASKTIQWHATQFQSVSGAGWGGP